MIFLKLRKKCKSYFFCKPSLIKGKYGKVEILVSDEAEEGKINIFILILLSLVLGGLLLIMWKNNNFF